MKLRAIILLLVFLLTCASGLLAPKQTFAQEASCRLFVPDNALTPQGLATPWILMNGGMTCHEADPNTAVFVQATIFSPSTKQFFVYSPLVIDAGTMPAIPPTPPNLPGDAVVGIWGGGNGGSTRLVGANQQCQNGSPLPFGQVFFCGIGGDTRTFFTAVANAGIMAPPLGTASDGMPCPTVRDFMVVDQDQSDNVQTQYLVTAAGQTAQDTTINRLALGVTAIAKNPSDNRVLTNFLDKAMGCVQWTAPDLANDGAPAFSQALDEIQAGQLQAAPQALVPAGDPMVLGPNASLNLSKINEYRAGVGQPLTTSLVGADTAAYCRNILATAPRRLNANSARFALFPSPVPAIGDSLWTFMAARLSVTLSQPLGVGLGCTGTGAEPGGLLNLPNPVHLMFNANGVAIAADIVSQEMQCPIQSTS